MYNRKIATYRRKTTPDSGLNSALWPSPTTTSHITPTESSGSFVLSGNQELLLPLRRLRRIFILRITVTKTASDLTALVLLRPLAPLLDHCFRLDVGWGSIQLTIFTSLVRPVTSQLTKLTLLILPFLVNNFRFFRSYNFVLKIGGIVLCFYLLNFIFCLADEPGKQAKSAVKIKNTSKSYVAFKVIYIRILSVIIHGWYTNNYNLRKSPLCCRKLGTFWDKNC